MEINQSNIKFFQYDAKNTIILRNKWKGKTDKEIAILMKEIDEDHQKLPEVKCPYKKPKIGDKYQIILN